MLGVFLLPAFTRQGHECQDVFESMQRNPCVHRPDLTLYSHLKEFLRNGVRTMLTPREKSPLPEAKRRFKSVMRHHVGQQAQHTTD